MTLSVNCNGGTSTVFLHCLGRGHLSLYNNGHVINLCKELHLWNLDVLGHLVDLFLDDGPLSLHCQLSDFRLLHFNCVDDVLNTRRLNDRHLNDHLSDCSRRSFDGLLHETLESRLGSKP